ncbi:hypothetical protein JQX13_21510 [Archangium violaceum]|uniref:hypothetical protein n=1 Tax=Archangium violaceum TaxID=83451 RepID=UPI00193C1499|nr:hypothetical protein [Archangium violaceum]QRK12371.1 hypothetical protein JQX13_21510 [Archangium violaceum]
MGLASGSVNQYAKKYGADPKVVAGIIARESSFKNHGVHRDGTGHGLIGLDRLVVHLQR